MASLHPLCIPTSSNDPVYRQHLPFPEDRAPPPGQLVAPTANNVQFKLSQSGFTSIIATFFTVSVISAMRAFPLALYRNQTTAYLAIYTMGIASFTSMLLIAAIQLFNIHLMGFSGYLLWINNMNDPSRWAQDFRASQGMTKNTGKYAGTNYGWSNDVQGLNMNDTGYRSPYPLKSGWETTDLNAEYPNGTVSKGSGKGGQDMLHSDSPGCEYWSFAQESTERAASYDFIRRNESFSLMAMRLIYLNLILQAFGQLLMFDGFMYHQECTSDGCLVLWPLYACLLFAFVIFIHRVLHLRRLAREIRIKANMVDYYDDVELTPNGFGFAGFRIKKDRRGTNGSLHQRGVAGSMI